VAYEDTVAGSADISGDPQPTRPMTADEMDAARKAQAGRTQQGPQSPLQGLEALAGQAKKKAEGAGKVASSAFNSALQKGEQALDGGDQKVQGGQGYENAPQDISALGRKFFADALRSAQAPTNPFSPADWFKAVKDDAGASWAAAHDLHDAYGYLVDPNRISNSVRMTWAKDDARSRITQAALTAYSYGVLPGAGGAGIANAEANQIQQSVVGAAAGKQAEQQVREADPSQAVSQKVAPGALTTVADPLNWLMGEGAVGMAAYTGGSMLSSLLSQDQGQVESSALWAAVTAGVMGMGHVPPGARKVLNAIFKDWPAAESAIKTAVKSNDAARKLAQNPFSKEVPDHIQAALDAANKDLGELNKGHVAVKPNLKVDPKTGELSQVLTDSQKQARAKFYKSLGVKDQGEFSKYVLEHGLDPAQTERFVNNYKALGFTDPLLQQGQADRIYVDPRQHLDDMKQQDPEAYARAARSIGSFHVVKQLAEAGPWGNDLSPAQSLMRGAVGWNHTLDMFEKNFMSDLKAVDPSLDGTMLARVAELGQEGQAEYDALSSNGKYVLDMYRLYANMVNQFERRAGVKIGQVTSYIPRIDEYISPLKRARGGAPSRILTPEFGKKRLWRTQAQGQFASIDPSELEPLRKQLGEVGSSLSHDELATLQHVINGVGAQDGESLMAFLRGLPNATSARKAIEGWWKGGVDYKPQSVGMSLVPAFKTVGDYNDYIAKVRSRFPGVLLGQPEGAGKLAKSEAGVEMNLKDPEIARIIREKDHKAAEDLAKVIFPNKVSNLFDILDSGHFSRQMKAAHAAETLKELEKTQVKVGDAAHFAAVKREADPRGNMPLRQLGYRTPLSAAGPYQDYLFAPQVADFIDKASRYSDLGFVEKLAQLEQKMVGLIMYSPLIHGMNMAGRIGAFSLSQTLLGNGGMLLDYLKHGKGLSAEERATAANLRRMEAWTKGVVTPHQARTVASDMGSTLSRALGDTKLGSLGVEVEDPAAHGSKAVKQKLQQLANLTGYSKIKSFNENANKVMWNAISDFGVAVYHIEKESAMRAGNPEENAAAWAARRANTWMGHVSELDHNPTVHTISRLALFAPNWWRTFGELIAPIYKESGIQWTPEMQRYVYKQQASTMISLLAMQKVMGNVMNYVTSGHSQFQNQPGHQDDIELSNPWLVQALKGAGFPGSDKIDPVLGYDPNSDGHMYMENPLARQQRSVESLAGLQSGYSDWKPSDVVSGGEKFLAARSSPLVNALATLGNIDLYGSLSTQSWRNINPDHNTPDGWNLVYAMLMATPLSGTVQPMARELSDKNQPDAPTGIAGTTVPKYLADMLNGAPHSIGGVLMSLAGVNAPYESSAKTRGTNLGDEDYRKIAAIDDQYSKQMTNLSQMAMTGQIPPDQWKNEYQQLSVNRRAGLSAILKGAPNSASGTTGMVADWESLYDQATDPNTGQLNQDILANLQNQFRQQHSQSEMDAMNAELRKNDSKYPMLALYRQSLDAYDQWKNQWAADSGVNLQQLNDESAEYSVLYPNQKAAAQYLHDHPDLSSYYRARSHQFYRSTTGMIYGLFVGNSQATALATKEGITPDEYQMLLAPQSGGRQ
jgi:hypothetical protein